MDTLKLGDYKTPVDDDDATQLAITIRICTAQSKAMKNFFGFTPKHPFPDVRHYRVLKLWSGQNQYEVRFNESETEALMYSSQGRCIGEVFEIIDNSRPERREKPIFFDQRVYDKIK